MVNQKSDIRQRCYQFSLNVIELADLLPKKRSAWVIADQLIRSATSIGANLVEAKASSSRLEFKKFYEISLKSANETIYWLGLLKDSGLADKIKIEKLENEVIELSRMLGSAVIKLKRRNL
ncbi:MAG: four helix bundle protein [Patescibacteria group bacterium]|nr:four helix bundle protein [Patescibacteria group bacterium]